MNQRHSFNPVSIKSIFIAGLLSLLVTAPLVADATVDDRGYSLDVLAADGGDGADDPSTLPASCSAVVTDGDAVPLPGTQAVDTATTADCLPIRGPPLS